MKRQRRQGLDIKKDYRQGERLKRVGEKWDDMFVEMGYEISLLGATGKDLAAVFGVNEHTIARWKSEHPDFGDAIERGRIKADAKVAKSLYQRAIGYSHPDVHVTSYQGEVTLTPITKTYPPDVAAIKFWLTNRQGDKWVDTHKVESTSNVHLHSDIKLSDISTEELKLMEKVGMRNLLQKMKN